MSTSATSGRKLFKDEVSGSGHSEDRLAEDETLVGDQGVRAG